MQAIAFLKSKNEPVVRQNSASATSPNMMTASGDGAERLAEIFREIFALSETDQAKSAVADDSIKLFESFDTQRASGTSDTPNEEQAFDPSNHADDQEPHR
jgi:flagellar motor protein MotB